MPMLDPTDGTIASPVMRKFWARRALDADRITDVQAQRSRRQPTQSDLVVPATGSRPLTIGQQIPRTESKPTTRNVDDPMRTWVKP